MTDSNLKHLELLGKEVSFVVVSKYLNKLIHTPLKGKITNIVFSLDTCPEISINDGDFYSLSEVIEFNVLGPI